MAKNKKTLQLASDNIGHEIEPFLIYSCRLNDDMTLLKCRFSIEDINPKDYRSLYLK